MSDIALKELLRRSSPTSTCSCVWIGTAATIPSDFSLSFLPAHHVDIKVVVVSSVESSMQKP